MPKVNETIYNEDGSVKYVAGDLVSGKQYAEIDPSATSKTGVPGAPFLAPPSQKTVIRHGKKTGAHPSTSGSGGGSTPKQKTAKAEESGEVGENN